MALAIPIAMQNPLGQSCSCEGYLQPSIAKLEAGSVQGRQLGAPECVGKAGQEVYAISSACEKGSSSAIIARTLCAVASAMCG